MLAAWFVLAIVTWVLRRLESRRDFLDAEAAWRRFGRRWLGLFSNIDEAIAGTQNTVGLYASDLVRLPWPGLPPMPEGWSPWDLLLLPLRLVFWLFGWVFVPLMNVVILPLAEWVISLVFRLKFQGSDRLGAYLTLMSPEPFSRAAFPDAPARGPLPPVLADPLHSLARQQVESKVLVVRGRFAEDARSPRSPKELLHNYFANIKITQDLIHNAYYDVEPIRRAIAYHILPSTSPDAIPDDGLGPAADARAWLDGEVPAPVPPDYLPRPKPPSATPLWTRCLLAAALVLLSILALQDLGADLQGPYIDRLVQKLTNPDDKSMADDADLLWQAYEMFRPRRGAPAGPANHSARHRDARKGAEVAPTIHRATTPESVPRSRVGP